jgi:glycerophosphoryl diester phosphodiesterase
MIGRNRIKYIAHRGNGWADTEIKENSIEACKIAGKNGFWGCETDVRKTCDGKFILSHDDNLSRIFGQNENEKIHTMTYKEVQEKTKNKMATLDEYLDVCIKYEMVPIVEIKDFYSKIDAMFDEEYLRKLYTTVANKMGDRKFYFISFDLDTLVKLDEMFDIKNNPNVSLQLLVSNGSGKPFYLSKIWKYKKHKLEISASIGSYTIFHLKFMRLNRFKIGLWVVNTEKRAKSFIRSHTCDYITTNYKIWKEEEPSLLEEKLLQKVAKLKAK